MQRVRADNGAGRGVGIDKQERPPKGGQKGANMFIVIDKLTGETIECEDREMAEGAVRVMVKWRNDFRKAGEKIDNKRNYEIRAV